MLLLLGIFGMQFRSYIPKDRMHHDFIPCENRSMNASKEIWMSHLCRELIWDCLCGGVQYYKLEEIDRVYDFLAGLNSKFDVVRGRVLGQRLIPTLMEVCSEVRLEEDRSIAMKVIATPVTDSVAFSSKSSSSTGDK